MAHALPIAMLSPTPANRLRIEIAPRTIFLLLGVVAGVWLLGQLATVLSVVIVALVLVGTFDPVVAWLERRGLRRGRALVLVFVVAALALAGVVLLMVPPLIAQLLHLIERRARRRASSSSTRLDGYGWAKPLVAAIQDLPLDDIGARAGGAMIGYSTKLLEIIGYGISTLFLAIYLLADPARAKGLRLRGRAAPPPRQAREDPARAQGHRRRLHARPADHVARDRGVRVRAADRARRRQRAARSRCSPGSPTSSRSSAATSRARRSSSR